MSSQVAELLDQLDGLRRIVAITGAGCSTASGIGDYRDRRGAWKRPPPIQMQDFVTRDSARRRYWARSMRGWPVVAAARPNAAHSALAELERHGLVDGLITQNVDGLHQQAGHRRVLELHGSLATVTCLDCGATSNRDELQQRLESDNAFVLEPAAAPTADGDAEFADGLDLSSFRVPACQRCGGVLKPDVVFYGDSVPRPRVAEAYALVDRAEALLVVGSSLMVFSAFRFCRRARERGIPLLAVNRGVTRADLWLQAKVEADCTVLLPVLVERLVDSVA